jgi:uncharacterized membrane protein YqjE
MDMRDPIEIGKKNLKMKLKERFQRKISMTVLQRQCLIIVTLMSTLLLITVWPRFRTDAMSVSWYVYLILVIVFLIPIIKRK